MKKNKLNLDSDVSSSQHWNENVSSVEDLDASESETINVLPDEDESTVVQVDTENNQVRTVANKSKSGKAGKIALGAIGVALLAGGGLFVANEFLFPPQTAQVPVQPRKPVEAMVDNTVEKVGEFADKVGESTSKAVDFVSDKTENAVEAVANKVEELPSLDDMFKDLPAEQPATTVSTPVVEEPKIEMPVIEEPLVISEPVLQEPVPVVEAAPVVVVEQPVPVQVQQPVVEVPVVEATPAIIVQEPAVKATLSEIDQISRSLQALEAKANEQNEINRRIDEVFGSVATKLQVYDATFQTVGKAFGEVDNRLTGIEKRLGQLESGTVVVKSAATPAPVEEPKVAPKAQKTEGNYIEFVGRGKPAKPAKTETVVSTKPVVEVKVEAPVKVEVKQEIAPEVKAPAQIQGKVRSILNGIAWVDLGDSTQIFKVGDKIKDRQIGRIEATNGIFDTNGHLIIKAH